MKKIRVSSETGRSDTVVEMPIFVPGQPSFDREKGLEYLARQLVLLGYQIHQLTPFMLHVSWAKSAPKVDVAPPFSSIHQLADELRRKKHR